MAKIIISNYNINNLDYKIFILLLQKYLFNYQLKKKLIIKVKSHLILKFKYIIINLNTKKYNNKNS
jgi:hypothetical protein